MAQKGRRGDQKGQPNPQGEGPGRSQAGGPPGAGKPTAHPGAPSGSVDDPPQGEPPVAAAGDSTDGAGADRSTDDANGPGDSAAATIDRLQAEVEALTTRALRARADYDNLQKRVERDRELERDRARARVLERFLEVYEWSRLAAIEAERTSGALAEGVKMVQRAFDRLLEEEGLERLGAVGEPFSAEIHEAVGTEEGDADPGHVSRVVTPGYRLGERVLRYAKVAVAPEAADAD